LWRWHAAAWAILAVVGALLFLQSYQRQGHPIVDIGRDFYVPTQILEGRALYRELLYNYGPVVPYLLAGVVAVFGDGLAVFEVFGIIVGIASMAALYALGTGLSGLAVGFVTVFLFLVFSFFSAVNSNFVLPFSSSATVATAFALWSFYCLLRYLYDGRSLRWLWCGVVLLLASLFTKQEVGMAVGVVFAFSWPAHRIPFKAIVATAVLTLVCGALFVAAFAARGPDEHALLSENLFKFSDYFGVSFYRAMGGLDYPVAHAIGTVMSFVTIVAIMLLASLAGFLFSAFQARRWLAAVAAIPAAACLWLIWRSAGVGLFRGSLVLAIALTAYLLIRNRRDPLLLVSLFVLAVAIRIPLRFSPLWYGFYLFVPAYLLVTYALGDRIARRLPCRRFVTGALIVLVAVLALRGELESFRSCRQRTSVLTTAKGVLRDVPVGRAEAIQQFLEYVGEHPAESRPTLVAFPTGVTLNYFADLTNPTAYYFFTQPEVGSPSTEQRMLAELDRTEPDYVVIEGNAQQYGRGGFGIDYATTLGDWIRKEYRVERVFRFSPQSTWQLVLLQRKDPGSN
jgi:hypothetical protein